MSGGTHKRKQRQGAGEARKLPSAAEAVPFLFEGSSSRFKSDLELTENLVEFLGEDSRFYAYGVYPPQTTTYRREDFDFSPEGWQELCAEHGKDPATTEEIAFSWDRSGAREAWRYADRWLTGLIGQYLLQARDFREVELLVEMLHPQPTEFDGEQMQKLVNGVIVEKDGSTRNRNDGFLSRARQLAALVRGHP